MLRAPSMCAARMRRGVHAGRAAGRRRCPVRLRPVGRGGVRAAGGLNDSKKLSCAAADCTPAVVLEVADRSLSVVIPAGRIDRDGPHYQHSGAWPRTQGGRGGRVGEPGRRVARGGQGCCSRLSAFRAPAGAREIRPPPRSRRRRSSQRKRVTRLMRRLDVDYPGYGFAVHKGYITRRA